MAGLYPATVVEVDFGGGGQGAELPPMPEPSGDWGEMRRFLREEDKSIFQNWFEQLQFVEFTNGTLVLGASSGFLARYIETHLSQTLMLAALRVFGQVNTLRIQEV